MSGSYRSLSGRTTASSSRVKWSCRKAVRSSARPPGMSSLRRSGRGRRGKMTAELTIPDLRPIERAGTPVDTGGPWVVILYNCDCHDFDEVIHQLQLATGCSITCAEQIAEEAHHRGRAIAFTGDEVEC